MHSKLNQLKKQINEISRRDKKSNGKRSKDYRNGKSLSFTKQEFKYKKADKKGKKKWNRSEVKSNSFVNASRKELFGKHAGYEQLMKKAPVNIFNIRNYNIMKSESIKEDFSLRKKGESQKRRKRLHSKKNSDSGKIHNFFVFIGNKPNHSKKNEKLNTLGSSSSKKEESKDIKKQAKLATIMKKKSASRENSRKKSLNSIADFKKRGSLLRDQDYNNDINPSIIEDLGSKIKEFTSELKQIRKDCENRTTEDSSPMRIKLSDRSDTTLKAMGRQADLMNHYQLQSTKIKTETAINELSKTMDMIKGLKKKQTGVACQTEEDVPEQISFSNLNMMNLMKEVAKEVLVKSRGMNPEIENMKEYFQKVGLSKADSDAQKQAMINSIFNFYQEQLIFEDALSLLQEKGVDLENLFIYAYERLKIKITDSESETKNDLFSEPSFTVVTDASLPVSSRLEESRLDIGLDAKIQVMNNPNHFQLDFEKIEKQRESSEEEDEEEED